jgi:hypothetical protein
VSAPFAGSIIPPNNAIPDRIENIEFFKVEKTIFVALLITKADTGQESANGEVCGRSSLIDDEARIVPFSGDVVVSDNFETLPVSSFGVS